jgi:hypothetical protein
MKKNHIPKFRAAVYHLIEIKDWETDGDKCIQEINDLQEKKVGYTQDVFEREDKLHAIVSTAHE